VVQVAGFRAAPSPARSSREAEDPALRPYLVAARADPPSPVSPEWRRAYRILDRLQGDVEARGTRLDVALLPAPWQVHPATGTGGRRSGACRESCSRGASRRT